MVLVQGAGKGVLKREGTACAKALGVCRSWQKASELAVREWRGERLEMRLGRRHELDQILVFSLRAVGNLSRILSRNDMKNIFLLKRSLWLQYLGRGWGYVIASWGHPLGGYCSEPERDTAGAWCRGWSWRSRAVVSVHGDLGDGTYRAW